MKKYLPCIILIALCIICVTIFYVNANEMESLPVTSLTTGSSAVIANTDTPAPPKVVIDKSGTFLSEYISDANLRIEWSMYKVENDESLYIGAELYLDTPDRVTEPCSGYIAIGGEKKEFTTSTMVGETNLLTSFSTAIKVAENSPVSFEAYVDLGSVASNGDTVNGIYARGTAMARGIDFKSSSKIDLNLISKFPELPSGEEITSLCMVLNYLKYKVDKSDLCDLYLDKGPAHFTDPSKANAGNPRDTYNSYGCLPPVIVNSANKFILANGGMHKALDISGYSAEELYREVSQGNPVIVWACESFESTPSILRTLIIDGKKIYLKTNVNTLVLIGYDFEKNTVTLANPSGNVFELDLDTFERAYSQLGSYAVVVK